MLTFKPPQVEEEAAAIRAEFRRTSGADAHLSHKGEGAGFAAATAATSGATLDSVTSFTTLHYIASHYITYYATLHEMTLRRDARLRAMMPCCIKLQCNVL